MLPKFQILHFLDYEIWLSLIIWIRSFSITVQSITIIKSYVISVRSAENTLLIKISYEDGTRQGMQYLYWSRSSFINALHLNDVGTEVVSSLANSDEWAVNYIIGIRPK